MSNDDHVNHLPGFPGSPDYIEPERSYRDEERDADNHEWDRAEAIAAMREDAEHVGDDSGPFDSYAYEGRIGGGL